MSAILRVQGLSASYGRVPVLNGINLDVNDGEILGVLGHNGMGKTTLLKALMGIIPATSIQMVFDGEDLSLLKSSGRGRLGIGYVPQGRGIFPTLSVLDNLRMGVAAHDMDEIDAVERVLADFPRLERLLDRDGGALSGGEQQLLALARCLISEPELILLDEPTEGIQPSIIDEIIELLQQLNKRTGISIVLVEQSLDFITALSDRVMLIQKGSIMVRFRDQRLLILHLSKNSLALALLVGRKNPYDILTSATPSKGVQANVTLEYMADNTRRTGATNATPPLIERISYMTVQRPTLSQMQDVVTELGMSMSDARITEFMEVMQGTLDAYDVVDSLPDYLPPVLYPRTCGVSSDLRRKSDERLVC